MKTRGMGTGTAWERSGDAWTASCDAWPHAAAAAWLLLPMFRSRDPEQSQLYRALLVGSSRDLERRESSGESLKEKVSVRLVHSGPGGTGTGARARLPLPTLNMGPSQLREACAE